MIDNKEINIKFIEGKEQRYPTCGDYWETDSSYEFRITKQDNPKHNMLILIHELVEAYLCKSRGIKFEDIDAFDIEWNRQFIEGVELSDEPGNEEDCLYAKEHRFAENIERQLAHEAGLEWFNYENNLKI